MISKWMGTDATQVRTDKGNLTLKGLFIPLFIEQLLMNMMGTVNTLVLGHYSDDAVAAVGAANQVMGLVYTFYAVISGGVSIVISHKLGAKDEESAKNSTFAALFLGAMVSILCSLFLYLAAVPIMSTLNLQGAVYDMAKEYFRICVSFSFLQGIISVISAILRSYGYPKTAVAVSILMNVLNAVLNYLIVYRPIELPLYGTEGIAIANVSSHMVAVVVIVLCFVRKRIPINLRMKGRELFNGMKVILRVGIPGGVSSLSYALSQVVSTSILAVLGTTALSAKVYISSIVFYVYVVGYSLGLATAILIGWMAGAEEYEKAEQLNRGVLRLAVTINIVLSVVLFLLYRPFVGLFTQSKQIIEMARGILFIDIFVEIGRAFNHIEENSLRGVGDVVYPMVVAIVSCWCVSILFSYILGVHLQFGLLGCWFAFMLDELFRGIMFWRRFHSRKWMKHNI